MDYKIENIQIYRNAKNERCLQFTASSPRLNNAASTVFSILTDDSEHKSGWYPINEALYCSINKEKVVIEIKDISSPNVRSMLLLVPAILLEKEIISEEVKDLLFVRIEADPAILPVNPSTAEQEAESLKAMRDTTFKKSY